MTRILLFTQPGCLSCELMRIYFEARQIVYEERDISADPEAHRTMTQELDSDQTPTVLILSEGNPEVVVGFDPKRLDQLLESAA